MSIRSASTAQVGFARLLGSIAPGLAVALAAASCGAAPTGSSSSPTVGMTSGAKAAAGSVSHSGSVPPPSLGPSGSAHRQSLSSFVAPSRAWARARSERREELAR
jgi:hypothetical protein